jgi:uncharacterized protein YndB with AHSA1/START domain
VSQTQTAQRGFTLTRTVDAPLDIVFRAWTDPDHLGWYLNPEQPMPAEPIEVDLRVGGYWRLMMVIDSETRFMTGGLYLEIDPPSRLVFAMGATDGWPRIDPDDIEQVPQVTLLLEQDGSGTRMVLDCRLPAGMSDERAAALLATPMRQGWSDTIDRLVAAYQSA